MSGILEWVQYFVTYMVVCWPTQPHRIQDLLGYQTQPSLEYQGDGWLGLPGLHAWTQIVQGHPRRYLNNSVVSVSVLIIPNTIGTY